MTPTTVDLIYYELNLELKYWESQLREYEIDRDSFSEDWRIYEARGRIAGLKKALERVTIAINQDTLNTLTTSVLEEQKPLDSAKEVEEIAPQEPELAGYTVSHAPGKCLEIDYYKMLVKVDRYEKIGNHWLAWVTVKISGQSEWKIGQRFWVPIFDLFQYFKPLESSPVTKLTPIYALGTLKNTTGLRRLLHLPNSYSIPSTPSLYHTIIQMPDGSKWQAIAQGKGYRWMCVWCKGDGYSDLFPVIV